MSLPDSKQPLPLLPPQLVNSSFLEVRTVDKSLVSEALERLPPLSEALRLCDIYSEYGKFMWVTFSWFPCHHISLTYKLFANTTIRTQRSGPCCRIPRQVSWTCPSFFNASSKFNTRFPRPFNSSEHFHALSLLFIILAIATLFDFTTQPYSTQ